LFDYTPRKVVQLVKLGADDTLLRMDALSICVSCGLCRDRCPVGIDVAAILDYFRGKARLQGIPATRPQVELFNGLFLDGVRNRGRISELHLVARFNLRSRRYLKDADLGAQLFRRGKLRLFSRRVKDKAGLRRLFKGTTAETPVPVSRAHAEKDA
jgi:heterodisulfide reductase subunit C